MKTQWEIHYIVYEDGLDEVLKVYPFRLQAVIWCFLNGYVNYGRGQYFLSPGIKIVKSESGK